MRAIKKSSNSSPTERLSLLRVKISRQDVKQYICQFLMHKLSCRASDGGMETLSANKQRQLQLDAETAAKRTGDLNRIWSNTRYTPHLNSNLGLKPIGLLY